MIGSSSGLPAERSTRKSSRFVFGPTLWNEAMQKSAAILRIDAASLRPIEAKPPCKEPSVVQLILLRIAQRGQSLGLRRSLMILALSQERLVSSIRTCPWLWIKLEQLLERT